MVVQALTTAAESARDNRAETGTSCRKHLNQIARTNTGSRLKDERCTDVTFRDGSGLG